MIRTATIFTYATVCRRPYRFASVYGTATGQLGAIDVLDERIRARVMIGHLLHATVNWLISVSGEGHCPTARRAELRSV